MAITKDIIVSWAKKDSDVCSLNRIMEWIEHRQCELSVKIKKVDFSYDGFWYYSEEDGYIRNKNNSFFQLAGYQEIDDDKIINEQPVIIQNEIGYLGILCKKINGILHFLMQAKIEPGNVNTIQISPTIQATKSNFTRMHGGSAPAYLEYFADTSKHQIIVDQIQSEQSSRFYKKRNRNIILYLEEDEKIDVCDSHKWMTLGQIKQLMNIDNLVNMDTRTVLSCIPFEREALNSEELKEIEELFNDKALYNSMFTNNKEDQGMFSRIFSEFNDRKMYKKENSRLVPLKSLKSWDVGKKEIVCKSAYDFKVIYCYIEIEGREVNYWEQPLIEANGVAILGLFTSIVEEKRKFLVKIKHEIGCFDEVELGPTIQLEPTNPKNSVDKIEKLFLTKLEEDVGKMKDVILSEEGGRFYHEQNRNVIIEVKEKEIGNLPSDYFWVDFTLLNKMIQFNNCVNIQLRNLISLLDI
jgi:oxidase EvaA